MALGNVLNPEFTTPGAADGQAADWTEAYPGDLAGTAPTVEEISRFTHTLLDPPYEGFEDSWITNELAVLSLSVATIEVALFEWQTGYLPYAGSLAYENFETSWSLPSVLIPSDPRFNHQSVFEYFDENFVKASTDTFETAWSNNQNSVNNYLVAVILAGMFDSGTPESVEDFEEEWHTNEDAVASYSAATTVDAVWDMGGLDTAENFENEWTTTYP
jgi:hypothetical protein